MNSVFEIAFPVFGIGILGYVATRCGYFSSQAGDGLARFVFDFAIPALLLRTFANADLPDVLPFNYIAAYYLPVALIYVSGIVIGKFVFARPFDGQVVTAFSFSYGNAVMLGLPLVLLIVGDSKALPYFILLSLHALTLFTVTTVLLEASKHRQTSTLRVSGKVVSGLLKNPILLGIIGGIGLNQLDISLPATIDTTLSFLQNSVAACSLFALGASMTKYGFAGQLTQSIAVVIAKNIVLPILVYFSCTVFFQLSAHWTFIAVLLAVQPTGINAYIFAERYRTAQGLATTSIFFSTLVSLITIPVLLYCYQSGLFD